MRAVPDPFVSIPFRTSGGFSYEPPSCTASVAVRCGDMDAPRALLMRAGRAAGMACDRAGGGIVAHVRLEEAGGKIRGFRCGQRVALMAGKAAVRASEPAILMEAFGAAIEAAPTVEAAAFERAAGIPLPAGAAAGGGAVRAIVFENLFRDPDSPGGMEDYFSCGAFHLASSLRSGGHEVLALKGRLEAPAGFDPLESLDRVLDRFRPDLVCITLLEACVEETAALVRHIRERSGALVAVGGPMATLSPEHAAVHLEGAGVIVRGDGEEAVIAVAGLSRALAAPGPLAPDVLDEVLSLEGTIVVRRGELVMGHPGRLNVLRDLDAAPFDVSLLEKRHVQGGLSVETSRGCVHPCMFCTAPSRGSFRGRSPRGIALRLRAYDERLGELWGEAPPPSARRIQIPDDDFACDPARAAAILGTIPGSGFLLSSLQASVRDFFRRAEDRWEADGTLPGALSPGLFQDAPLLGEAAAGPPSGTRGRGLNSFVKLGVESFCDEELRRLGKGYRSAQVREVVGLLDRRGIVHDAYLIFTNRRTRINDIVTSLMEIARLKIENPSTFFIRLPIVPRLVTTVVSPGYRLWLKGGARSGGGDIEIGSWLRADGFPEYDYPLVTHDVPGDPLAQRAAERVAAIFEPDGMYLKPLANLRAMILEALPGIERSLGPASPEASDGRLAARRLHDAGRLIVIEGIKRGREMKIPKSAARGYHLAAAALGSPGEIAGQVRRSIEAGDPRLVLIPTRDCSLRCRYCPMIKEEGKVMDGATARKAVELLLSSARPSVILQFFGGEALLRRSFVLEVMEEARVMAARADKDLGFIVSTNGVSLDEELLVRLRAMRVKVEVSIDGTREVHMRHRVGKDPAVCSYDCVGRITPALLLSGIPHDAIMVVNPDTVEALSESFSHVAALGYRRIQINHALGVLWSKDQMRAFAGQLHEIEKGHFGRTVRPGGLELVDLWSFRRPMLLNGELTVDFDGTISFGNGFLVRTSTPGAFRAGHLDDLEGFDAYYVRRPDNDYLLAHTYPKDVTRNNLEVGKILGSFVRHIRERFPDAFASMVPTRAPEAPSHPW